MPGIARDGGWIVVAHPRSPFGVVRFEGAHYDRRLASMNECPIHTWPSHAVVCIFGTEKARPIGDWRIMIRYLASEETTKK